MTRNAGFDAERRKIDQRLNEICETYLAGLSSEIALPIQYALRGAGKRLRPLLLLLAYRAAGGVGDATLLACAPEVVHAYSLIHDDLPCMDDDDMRRGRPTVHRAYGSRAAIIAGVSMVPLAVMVARDGIEALDLHSAKAPEILATLLVSAGAAGMIGGQLRDLSAEGLSLSVDQREAIHSAKTGALITACVRIGALAAGGGEKTILALTHYARKIGLAYQIMDDVLDVTSTSGALGKTAGRDATLGKSSYPALLGVDGARAKAKDLMDDALEALSTQELLTPELSQVANFMVTRTF